MRAIPAEATWSPADQSTATWAIGLGLLISIVMTAGLATHLWVVGSVEGGWVYSYSRRPSAHLVAGWIAWSAAVAGFALLVFRLNLRRPLLVLAAWVVCATAWELSLRVAAPYPLDALFASDNANSFYSVAHQRSVGEVLGEFDRVRAAAPLHVQSNMPGKVLLIQALLLISESTRVLPWLVVGLSNLGAFVMFGFVRDLFGDDRAAVHAGALYLFLPSRNFFFPLQNTITPIVILLFGWLVLRWLATGRLQYAVLAGFALFGVAAFEPLPLVTGLLFLVLTLAAIGRGSVTWERVVFHIGIGALAFVGVAELVNVVFGFDIARTFRSIARHAAEFNETAGRPYAIWVVRNLWEFGFGVGYCQACLLVVAFRRGLSGPGPWPRRLLEPLTAVTIGLLAVLAVTNLLGINRGEVLRLWIFLAALLQLPAAYVCARLSSPGPLAVVLGATALQTAAAVSLIQFVIP